MPAIPRRIQSSLAALIALSGLTGCVHDSASYAMDEARDRVITLQRSQTWFWDKRAQVAVQVLGKPACIGGGEIDAVPLDAEMELFRPPEIYAEPLHILRVENDYWAISTQSCRIQKFAEPPEDLGVRVGVFRQEQGALRFEPEGGEGG